ncbi:MAG: S49 family peptidase [Burkholderiales bacterium]|nr:S49 family peptidase [Burkholderiales bacterium]
MMEKENWERETLEKLAFHALQESRRARHWSIFFKSLTFAFLFGVLYLAFKGSNEISPRLSGRHTALVELTGVISADTPASADEINASLEDAFKDKDTQGVILQIDSPGGSPVQAGQINDEIVKLRKEYPGIPIYAVVGEMCASGAYYIAVAADKIYVDKASMVGSIGVLMDGFGFTGAMQKLGVERRLLTAGKNKGFLDPYSPMSDEQKGYAMQMLEEIHQQFIHAVRAGRGSRLKETPDMYSGLIWTGQKSIELGLSDALGTTDYVAEKVIGAKDIVDYSPKENIAVRVAKKFGVTMGSSMLQSLQLR